uniref:U1-type domain-containing protein n=1 Tax=Caenorhabditis japonica TaxID=281687 RepID=A0A8R1DXP4_CAEJA
MTIIRRRAKDALRGNRPDQPIDEEEENLTMRLIVNVATSLGVRDKLEGFLCPHPNGHCDEQQNSRQSSSQNSSQSPIHRHLETQRFLTPSPEEIIVPFVTSSRQRTLYCKVCNCKVPEVAKQGHENGRRHVANLT